MIDKDNAHAWWWAMPESERERFNRIARESILQLDSYPYSSAEASAELLAWAALEAEVTEAHVQWLTHTKAKFERNGWPWTTDELARRAHLWEHE